MRVSYPLEPETNFFCAFSAGHSFTLIPRARKLTLEAILRRRFAANSPTRRLCPLALLSFIPTIAIHQEQTAIVG